MITTEHIAKSDYLPKAGVFAMLRGLLGVKGTGACSASGSRASKGNHARRRGLGVVVATAAIFVLALAGASSALAAAPTVISESVSGVKATEARVEALVNPENEVMTECHFQYGTTSVTEHEVFCETPLIEGEEQGVGVTLWGLTQNKHYHFRVVLKNLAAEEAKGNEETFTTAVPPEAPVTKSPAAEIKATTAKLEGTLNPHSEATSGWYFAYSNPGGTSCLEGPNTGQETEVLAKELAVGKTLEGLQPHQKYVFCLIATNAAGETTAANE